MASTLETRNFTRSTAPVFPFKKAVEAVLPGWNISLVFAGETRAEKLNMTLRKKSYIPNVLSYEVGTRSGEIIICPMIAKKQAPLYDLSYTHMMGFLFIHGLLHLKGLPHGATMDKKEREILSRLTNVHTQNVSKNRHRN